jgi:hypothetical protein
VIAHTPTLPTRHSSVCKDSKERFDDDERTHLILGWGFTIQAPVVLNVTTRASHSRRLDSLPFSDVKTMIVGSMIVPLINESERIT